MTVDAVDVAGFIREQKGPMITLKLQKLVHYAQGGAPMYSEEIQAWPIGPIVTSVFAFHQGGASGFVQRFPDRRSIQTHPRSAGHGSISEIDFPVQAR